MFVYFARPIDQAGTSSWLGSLETTVRHKLFLAGAGAFLPHLAYAGSMGDQSHTRYIDTMNNLALYNADALVAILPAGVPTLGVPVEIENALTFNKPTVIFTDIPASVQLAAWGNRGAEVIDLSDVDAMIPESDDLRSLLTVLPRPEEEPSAPVEDLLIRMSSSASKMPSRAYRGDAGLDLAVVGEHEIDPGEYKLLPTGVYAAVPDGYFGLMTGRSSTWAKYEFDVRLAVIDSGYRGELMVGVHNRGSERKIVFTGTRLAQYVLLPAFMGDVVEVDDLPPHERGTNGYGSSGH